MVQRTGGEGGRGTGDGSSDIVSSKLLSEHAMTTRRELVGTAPALLLPWHAAKKLPLGFSTLGCPSWPWPRILDFAAEQQFASVELRGILTNMDLTKVPELAPERIAEARRQLAAHELSVSCLGASAQMHDMD